MSLRFPSLYVRPRALYQSKWGFVCVWGRSSRTIYPNRLRGAMIKPALPSPSAGDGADSVLTARLLLPCASTIAVDLFCPARSCLRRPYRCHRRRSRHRAPRGRRPHFGRQDRESIAFLGLRIAAAHCVPNRDKGTGKFNRVRSSRSTFLSPWTSEARNNNAYCWLLECVAFSPLVRARSDVLPPSTKSF